MQHLEVSGAVRPLQSSLGVKRLSCFTCSNIDPSISILVRQVFSFKNHYDVMYSAILMYRFIDIFALGSSSYGPNAPRPFRRFPCAPYSDIRSGESCRFTKVPDGPPELKSQCPLVPRKEPRCTILLSQESRQANTLQVPRCGPYVDTYPLTGYFTSLLIYLFISKALRREPPPIFPQSLVLIETDAHSRALLNICFGVRSIGALPPDPPHGIPSEKDAAFLESSFIHHAKSPIYELLVHIPVSART